MSRAKTGGNISIEELSEKKEIIETPIIEEELSETEKAIREADEIKAKREEVLVDFVFDLNLSDCGTMYFAGETVQITKKNAERFKNLGFGR